MRRSAVPAVTSTGLGRKRAALEMDVVGWIGLQDGSQRPPDREGNSFDSPQNTYPPVL